MKQLVVGIGEALWDMLPEGKKLGGAPANFAYHISQLGLEGCVVSAVGGDALGEEILGCVGDRGISNKISKVEYPTGTVEVTLDANGVPQYQIKEGVAWDNIPFDSELEEIAGKTKVVCFGSLAQRSGISRDTIRKFIKAMPEDESTMKVFDINLRCNFYTKELLQESIMMADVLKINDEELEIVSDMFGFAKDGFENQCWILLSKFNLKMVILTCGTNGSYVFVPGEISYQPTPVVKVADTVGAGDSFTAGFIGSVLKGKSISEAHRLATEIAAYVCTCNGAMPVLPEELRK